MNNMSRVLVIGKGHLGTYLSTAWGCVQWKGPMQNLSKEHLELLKPSAVVIAAGKTDLKWCEENRKECWKQNVYAPWTVCDKVRQYNEYLPIFHLSTGCAWQGPYHNGEPFRPYDPPEPVCVYTESKVACDNELRKDFKNILILRPRLLYSSSMSPRNTFLKILKYPNLINTPNSVTCVLTVKKTIESILENYGFFSDFPNKIMNVYDRGAVSPYQIGCLQHVLGARPNHPQKISKEDLDSHHKPKRADVVLYDPVFEKIVNPDYALSMLEACSNVRTWSKVVK